MAHDSGLAVARPRCAGGSRRGVAADAAILDPVAVALSLTGLDFVTSVSGAGAALANIGPGLGDIIGPAGNFSSLNDTAKWILSFAMLLGRLEVYTLLVLLTPAFWRG